MRRVAIILGIIGGIAALALGGAGLSLMRDEVGTARDMHALLAYGLMPLGVIGIVGAFLAVGGRRRRASLWLLFIVGVLMLAVAAVDYVVVWRSADLGLSYANIGLVAPGVVTVIAALFEVGSKAKQ